MDAINRTLPNIGANAEYCCSPYYTKISENTANTMKWRSLDDKNVLLSLLAEAPKTMTDIRVYIAKQDIS